MCKKISNEPWYKRILNKIICKKINPIAGDLPGGDGKSNPIKKEIIANKSRKIKG